MNGISMSAFFGELEKIAASRDMSSPWSSQTIGAPRSKLPSVQLPKAPTAPGPMNSKLVMPAAKYGPRQNYSQPNPVAPPTGAPDQGAVARDQPPPNVL